MASKSLGRRRSQGVTKSEYCTKKTEKLRQLLKKPGVIVAPGATDAFVARLIEAAGFPAVYVTGAGIANTLLGVPDVGLTTMTEVVGQARNIALSVDVPIIADADTGYGNPINVIRTQNEFERAGVAGIHIEDQMWPKKCGHFEGKNVIPKGEMVKKIQAAVESRKDPDFIIIARTDARSVTGLKDAISRAKAYAKAGADMVFVEAPQSKEEMRLIAESLHVPLVANMVEGGKTPLLDAAELEKIGYKLVIYPNLALRVGAVAIREALKVLKERGTSKPLLDKILPWDERQQIVGLPKILELEKKYAVDQPHDSFDLRKRAFS